MLFRSDEIIEEERISIDPIDMAEAKKKIPSKNKFSENLYESILLNIPSILTLFF